MIAPGPDNVYFKVVRGLAYSWVAALILALYPYTEDPAEPIKLLSSAAAAVAMSAVWAAGVASGRAPYRALHAAFYVLFAFLASQGLAAALSDFPLRSLDALHSVFVFTIIAFVVYQTFPEGRHLRALLRVIVLSVTLSSLYALVQYAGLDPFPWADRAVEEYRGLPATYGNPNLAGHTLVIALVLCAGLGVDAGRRGRLRELAACIAMGAAMLLHLYATGMRGGAVALAFAGCFAATYRLALRRGSTPARAGAFGAGAAGLLLVLAAGTGIVLAPHLPLDSSLQLRLNGYAGAAAMFLDNTLHGVGPGNYAARAIPYWTEFESLWYALEGKRNFHVHNEWLEIAAESGVPGLALFIALILFAALGPFASPFFANSKQRALFAALPAALVAAAADACTGFNLHAPASGALFLLLAMQQPGATHPAPLRGVTRLLPAALLILALFHGTSLWRHFQAARLYQQAQGALEWASVQREGGNLEAARHGVSIASAALSEAARRTPWDYKIPMRAGDLALEEGQWTQAILNYETALACSPHLPRLHVQLARAQLRVAGEIQGPARTQAREIAADHAGKALAYAPELADAWLISGWTAYLLAEGLDATIAVDPLNEAVRAFEEARKLGLVHDPTLDAALSRACGRLGRWPESAEAAERCVMAEPNHEAHWDQFARAAGEAGPTQTRRYRQALLYHVSRLAESEGARPALTAGNLAARLATLNSAPSELRVTALALQRALARHPDDLVLWGAWLLAVPDGGRREALRGEATSLNEAGAALSPPVSSLLAAMARPDVPALEAAAEALRRALATAPGTERPAYLAQACAPLAALLEQTMADSALSPALLGKARADLGAAHFECGAYASADRLLRQAESTLPAAQWGPVHYYRSRVALALGQPEAALTLVQQVVRTDPSPPEYQWQLARCLAATGQTEAAVYLYAALRSSLPPDHPYQAPLTEAQRPLSAPAMEALQ